MRQKQLFHVLCVVILIAVYLFLSNKNATLDAYGYAACIKNGEHLFLPHHLLYNWFFYQITQLPLLNNLDVLTLTQVGNGIFALGSLFVLYRIILLLYSNQKLAFYLSISVGATFACLRYGTENETYILPLFYSLLGSFFFLHFYNYSKNIHLILSGLFLAMACLFHQLHFFWWFAVFVGLFFIKHKQWTSIGLYTITAFVVPIVYCIVYATQFDELSINGLVSFVFEYYYSDDADTKITLLNFILTPISLVRSFVQVHGNLLDVFRANVIFSVIAIVLSVVCLLRFIFPIKITRNRQGGLFVFVHFLAFILHLLFAFYSAGNAEFMVMLPFLLAISLPAFFKIKANRLMYLFAGLFIWNVYFAILPNFIYNYLNDEAMAEYIYYNQEEKFLLYDKYRVANMIYYKRGIDLTDELYDITDVEHLRSGIYTTNGLNRAEPLSRRSFINQSELPLAYTKIVQLDSISNFYGGYTIDKIEIAQE